MGLNKLFADFGNEFLEPTYVGAIFLWRTALFSFTISKKMIIFVGLSLILRIVPICWK